MANTTLTQTGAQVQADLNLLDSNSATAGQVLTANGSGGCSWANASGGGYTLTITDAYEQYWVFFADGSSQNYQAGVVGTYHNVVALGIDNDAMLVNYTGFYLYCEGTSFSGGQLPLSAFHNATLTGITKLRILLSDFTCVIDTD